MCYNGFFRKINLFKYKSHFKAYSKHELSTIDMLSVSQKKLSYYTPTSPQRPPLHNGHFPLSTGWPLWRGSTVFSSNSNTTSPLDSNSNNFNVPSRTNLTDFRRQFFCERKAQVMTPHNTGGRDDLLLRFRARTFPQLLQYCWRLQTGFLIACFILHLLLDFLSGVSPLLGPLSPNLSLTN